MNIPEFDDTRLPIKLGSPLKVPHYAWSDWGIIYHNENEFEELVRMSENGYEQEWMSTCEEGHKDISLASERAGLGDANEKLNEQNAQIVSKLVKYFNNDVKILDLGAGVGATTVKIFEKLEDNKKERAFFLLIDPASKASQEAEAKLNKIGLKIGKNFDIKIATDLDIPRVIKEQQDIVTSVAAIHHHAYLTRPFENIYNIIEEKGFFITADWHNSMWEHPCRVYELLTELDWVSKESDLCNFKRIYPRAVRNCSKLKKEDMIANEMIKNFWKEYCSVRKYGKSNFMILEGHRPAEKYIDEMKKVGFKTGTDLIKKLILHNPYQILPNSSLLCLTIGQKA